MLLGAILSRQNRALPVLQNISESEFKVYSQSGEDGILQYLIEKVGVDSKVFIEFGVENYLESNTRFLLRQNNWKGVVIDGSQTAIDFIKSDDIYVFNDLTALCAFITKDNINKLLSDAGMVGSVGVLSVDVDGNDYWIWGAIDVVNPQIVVAEYNSVFGPSRAITIPYKSDFVRTKAHFSNLYFGASLGALVELGKRKGYSLVGCNSMGNNAFFVRRDKVGPLKELSAAEAFVESKFRESRSRSGVLTHISGASRAEAIRGMPVFNISSGEIEPF